MALQQLHRLRDALQSNAMSIWLPAQQLLPASCCGVGGTQLCQRLLWRGAGAAWAGAGAWAPQMGLHGCQGGVWGGGASSGLYGVCLLLPPRHLLGRVGGLVVVCVTSTTIMDTVMQRS